MEQAVNTFLKGLQMDVNPMVQGNDVLSDALNATLVTMNGNEVILQNDMGNRRIDNAYLPPGYEPIGIKEYGGIIYIAAYNPLTNMSLVGSFPSPERKINVLDDPNLGGELDFDKFEIKDSSPLTLATDSLLIPLTAKNSLHIGDKFVVYSKDLPNTNISNWENISGDKVETPKNKCYTLALGILNSLNEFVDITKSLVRWNENSIIKEELKDKSDLYKFNKGYFIAKSLNDTCKKYTKNDSNLIKERQTIAANTYAYKLVGPLYLKATLNHILEFNYNIYGSITKKDTNENPTKYEIVIEGYLTYNCPDGVTGGNGDSNYYTYNVGKVDLNNGYPFFTFSNTGEYTITESGVEVINNPITSYNSETNLYSVKLVKKYGELEATSNIVNYALGVIANEDKLLIVPSLSTIGQIDLSKLGSGDLELKGWRFYNYENKTKLTYNFEAYPKYGERFTNLTMIFTEVNPSLGENETLHTFSLENQSVYNGKNTIEIDWEKEGVKPRTLYLVKITYSTEPIFDTGDDNNDSLNTNTEVDPNPSVNPSRGINRDTPASDILGEGGSHAGSNTGGGNQHNYVPVNPYEYPDKFDEKDEKDEKEELIPTTEEISYKIKTPTTNSESPVKVGLEDLIFYRWFLSTPLLNDCYNSTSDFFIKDYCLPKKGELNILKSKLTLQPSVDLSLTDSSYPEEEEIGEWFVLKQNSSYPDIVKTIKHTYKLNLGINLGLGIYNYMLYPKWAKIGFSDLPTFSITSDKLDAKDLLKLVNIKGNYYSNEELTTGDTDTEKKINANIISLGLNNFIMTNLAINSLLYSKDFEYYDFIKSKASDNGSIYNVYGPALSTENSNSIENDYFLKSIYDNNSELVNHVVLGTTFHHNNVHRDDKLYIYTNSRDFKFNIDSEQDVKYSEPSDVLEIFPRDSELTLATKDFLSGIDSTSVISYFFDYYPDGGKRNISSNRTSILSNKDENSNIYCSAASNARLFWRKNNGYWTVFDTLLTTNIDINGNTSEAAILQGGLILEIRNVIKKELFKNLNVTYCFKDEENFSNLNLAHISNDLSNYRYNEFYSININYNIEVKGKYASLKNVAVKLVSTEEDSTNNAGYTFFETLAGNNTTFTNNMIHPVTFKSNENFSLKVEEMLSGKYSNMDIYGNTLTSESQSSLNKYKLYIYDSLTKKIIKEAELKNYKITPEFGVNGYNTIVYTGSEPAQLSKPYDVNYGDGDGSGVVSYTTLELYKPVM